MNIKHLEHLLALADTGSFSRAAEKLFLTQSALSRSIQSLEIDLGAKVLDRIGKRNELTPLGQDVVARARHIVREAAELRQSAKLLQDGGRGSISVGLGSGPAALLLVPLMCAASTRAGMRVAVTQGPVELQILQLRSRQLDAMVVDLEYLGRESYMPRFVVLRQGVQLDAVLRERLNEAIRSALSPRFVPNDIFEVPEVPRTLSGKKQELPIKKLLLGQPLDKVVNREAMANPHCLDWYVAFAQSRVGKG